MRNHAVLFGAVLGLLGACGDDEAKPGAADAAPAVDAAASCVDPSVFTPGDDYFGSPAAFDRSACEPGSLAGVDPTGLWFSKEDPHPRWGRGPVKLSLSCDRGLEVGLSYIASNEPVEELYLDDDDLFFRQAWDYGENFRYIVAYDICKREADGALVGRAATCWLSDFGEQCDERAVRLTPYGRNVGEAEADGIELVAEWNGGATPWPEAFTADVRVHGDIAYVARERDGVRIVDVSDVEAPADLGYFESVGDNYNELNVVEGSDGKLYLLVASAQAGIIVVDVEDPTSPQEVARISLAMEWAGAHTFHVETVDATTYAYVADGYSDNVFVFDVTDPPNVSQVGTFNLGNTDWGVHAVYVDQGRAYINATVGGLIVADLLPDPSAASVLGRYAKDDLYAHQAWTTIAGGRPVALHGDEGYGSHLEVIDIDPDSDGFMTRIGELDIRYEVSIHDMRAVGEKVYVAHYQDGLRIVDVSDPTNPTQTAYYNTWSPERAPGAMLEGAVGLAVANGLIYVADTPRGLLILRETGE